MAKHTRKSGGGTSFHGTTIVTTVGKLIKLFPNSYDDNNDGSDKVNYDFTLETSDGDVFTIYDWKYYRPIGNDEEIEFHIGGKNSSVTEQAKAELLALLNPNVQNKLIDRVIEKIKEDIADGDVTALDELLKFIPIENLIAFLPENEHKNYKK